MRLPQWVRSYLNRHPGLRGKLRAVYAALAGVGREAGPGREPAAAPVEAPAERLARLKQAFTATSEAALGSFLAAGGELTLRTSADPVVSILLVTFNRADLTFACLRSLADACDEPFEVIVVDNGSTDSTRRLLERVRGLRAVLNAENVHFVRGANQAAALARGEILLFLNNDVQLLPGAVTAAVRTLRTSRDVGAVGGKIVLLDGTLQEAGSIVWSDGSCLGYGRGRDPLGPEYMFRREVDYCSGAFLLTRRATFEALGGLDLDYAPAYYEEADYCLRLWERGLRVIYDPQAVALHFEFASSSSSDAAIALQVKHRAVFSAKRDLAGHPAADLSRALFARDRRRGGLRVLFVEDRVPHPSLGSGLPRANQLLRCLVDLGHFATFYPLGLPVGDWEETYRDVPREVEVMLGPGKDGLAAFLRARKGYYDALVISRPHNMRFLEEILTNQEPGVAARTRIIYDAEALFCLREIAGRQLRGEAVPPAEAERLIAEEVALTRRAHAVISVSSGEAAAFRERGVGEVHVLSQALTVNPSPSGFESRRGFLFVGAVHEEGSPNADSLVWFLEEVWPRVIEALGPTDFLVAGVNNSQRVRQLAQDGVQFLGRREHLQPLYDAARVFVAPTRFGAGIPLKVQEAAAHGLPVVTTPVMARQLGWEHGGQVLMADGAAAFAERCVELYRSADLWERLRRQALERVAADCSPARFALELDRILKGPGARTAPSVGRGVLGSTGGQLERAAAQGG
jgi:O-antigen biosynthesis protein